MHDSGTCRNRDGYSDIEGWTSDGFHDERVDRTTDGTGFLRDYTYEELRHLHIDAGDGKSEQIPCIGAASG